MAARKPSKKTVDVDGIAVEIDVAYVQSWDGVMQCVEMQRMSADEDVSDAEKTMALLGYYSRAVANIDEIKDALGGGAVPFDKVFNVISRAISDGQGKN